MRGILLQIGPAAQGRRSRALARVDLHVAWLLVLVVPPSIFLLPLPWTALPAVLLPQGNVMTPFADERQAGDRTDARRYLFVNQLLLLIVGVLASVLKAAISKGP